MSQSLVSTPTSTIFLDANILLEIILERDKQSLAKELLEKHSSDLYISALTAHLVVHFGQSRVELLILRQFLGDYSIIPLDAADFEWAFTNARNKDFEDALQLAVAIRYGCSGFITLDKSLVEAYQQLPAIAIELLS